MQMSCVWEKVEIRENRVNMTNSYIAQAGVEKLKKGNGKEETMK